MADSIQHSIVVLAMLDDVFSIWSNFDNFPIFMDHLKAVTMTGDRASHWVMEGPLGTRIEWDAETTRLEPNRAIAWRSTEGSAVKNSGQVTFKEVGPNETEISLEMSYDPPAGAVGEVAAELFANPSARVRQALERFKEYVESTSERLRDEPREE